MAQTKKQGISLLGLLVIFAASPLIATAEMIIEEIVVTAQKREESTQDIPIAVSAFDERTLKNLDAKGFEAIIALTPGLAGSADADSQSVLTIRGIGTNAFSPGADNSVGTYFNEIPISRNIGSQGYLDVKRIEVVKGPQGTLFGRNTSSGAISITNNPADFDTNELSVRGAFGNEEQQLYELIGNYAISDTFAVRFAARHDERDGTFKNTLDGDELNGRNHDQYRLSLSWAPSEQTELSLFWEEFEMENRWQMLDASSDIFVSDVSVDNEPDQSVESSLVGLKIVHGFSNTLTLTSNSGFFISDIIALPTDADTFDIPIVDFVEPWELEQFTQEFRLNGMGDNIDWFVGASYYREEAEVTTLLTIYEEPGLDVLFVDSGLCAFAATLGLTCGVHQESNNAFNKTTSWAVYGDLIFRPTDRMSVTVGARYTKDKKDMQINAPLTDSTLTALVGLVTGTANNAVFNFTPGLISSSDEWTSFDPRLAVDYAITSELLVYASIAKGFKSGGFNRQPLLPGDSGILSFDAEENTAFEIGLKTDFWERRARVNLALYQYDYEDFQLETNRGGAILIQNAANLETSGIEVEARFLLTERIDLRVAFARQKAEFDKGSIDDGAGTIVDLKGLDAPRAPKTTASLIADFQITDQIDFNLSYTHTDEMFYTADNRVELLAEDFQLVNARLNFSSSDDRWGASIVGENLTDEEYTSSMIDFLLPMALPGMGRLIRVEARYNF